MFNKIIPGVLRKFFTFTGPFIGDNRLATINDVNNLISQLNLSGNNSKESIVISVSDLPGLALSVATVQCTCQGGGSGCPTCLNACAYSCKSTAALTANAAPGTYDLVITPSPNTTYYGSYVNVYNFLLPTSLATVEKISNFVYVIKTYNAGVAAFDLFNNTTIEIVLLTTNVEG
jgi:hypothetical protein